MSTLENGASVGGDDDRQSILGVAKTRILGQMKNQFNSSGTGTASSSESDLLAPHDAEEDGDVPEEDTTDSERKREAPLSEKSTDESESSVNEDVQPPIIMSIRRQERQERPPPKRKMTTRSALLKKSPEPEQDSESEGLKRSTRRRSKDCNESVLQSAIARKEKFYTETSKPQRLTRQLKPTQKILDNIASASAAAAAAGSNKSPKKEKKRNCKPTADKDNNSTSTSTSTKKRKSDASPEGPEAKCRRSGRFTQSQSQGQSQSSLLLVNNSESDSDAHKHDDANGVKDESDDFSSYLDADSATAQLIASRLCVCTSPTKYTPLSESSIFCNALDSINHRLIGCNNSVSRESAWMLRPSTRVPYMVLCKLHQARLQEHHCCAMCGIFCTQGGFLQCLNKHLYHKGCKLSIGALECCPHCGSTEQHRSVALTMKTDAPPVYTATQCVGAAAPSTVTDRKHAARLGKPKRTPPKQSHSHTKAQSQPACKKRQAQRPESAKTPAPPKALFREFYDDVKQEKYDEDEDEAEMQAQTQALAQAMIKQEVEELEQELDAPLIVCNDELVELERLETMAKRHDDGDVDSADGDTPEHTIHELFEAIRNGLYAEVATLLGENDLNLSELVKYPETSDDNHDEAECGTVLHFAAMNGLVPIMHMLKIADMDLNLPDSENNTPLMVAVSHFQGESVKYLTTAGAAVTAKGTDGMTALHLACKCGNLQATKELLLAAAHIKGFIDCQDDGGWTPLVWACEHNHVDVVKLLLSENANPQIADVEGNVALHWAAFGGSIAIVELILNFGGLVDSVNDQGDTPLHIAARHDNYNCVMVFVTRGACFTTKNDSEETALECAPAGSKSHQTLVVNNKLKVLINKK